MTYTQQILKENRGIITSSICDEKGIPRAYLTLLVRQGILKRMARGIYTP